MGVAKAGWGAGPAPSPATTGGDWEGVAMVRADPKGTPPQPSPACAGEGAKARGLGRSHKVTLEKGRGSMFRSPFPIPAFDPRSRSTSGTRADSSDRKSVV